MFLSLRFFSSILLAALCCCLISSQFVAARQNHFVPQRIVSLGPINTENVFLLGAGDRLVGNTTYCVNPPAAVEKTKVGSVMEVSIEKIISLRPDLVLATPLTRPKQLKQLKKLGIRVVQFRRSTSFAEICEQFLRLGNLLGLEKRADEIISWARQEVEAVQKRFAGTPPPKVLLQIGSRPLYVSAGNSFTHDFIQYSNGTNIAGKRNDGAINYEHVLAENPDIILIAIMGSETGVASMEKKKWYSFADLRAVQKDRVHVVNPDLVCSPSPKSFVKALEMLAALIHPDKEKQPI